MGKIVFIIGGARSGKSSYAFQRAKRKKTVAFFATAQAGDAEMKQRIMLHRKARPAGWKTFECPHNLASALEKNAHKFTAVIIDCLTLWAANLLLGRKKPEFIKSEAFKMIACLRRKKCSSFIVANEVGLGIVPDNRLARDFRDVAGMLNQLVAAHADEVFLLTAGIALKIKENRKITYKTG